MSTHTHNPYNSLPDKKIGITGTGSNLAPRPPILEEKDNSKSPRIGGYRGHYVTTKKFHFDPFYFLRRWVNNIEVTNYKFAHFLCNLIPCSCPFERDVTILGKTWQIPPLCKINPLYNEVVSLRLRALSYLEGDCGEDITQYIC